MIIVPSFLTLQYCGCYCKFLLWEHTYSTQHLLQILHYQYIKLMNTMQVLAQTSHCCMSDCDWNFTSQERDKKYRQIDIYCCFARQSQYHQSLHSDTWNSPDVVKQTPLPGVSKQGLQALHKFFHNLRPAPPQRNTGQVSEWELCQQLQARYYPIYTKAATRVIWVQPQILQLSHAAQFQRYT